MKLEIDTRSYNQRRYGKPYIATVDFSSSTSGTPTWGEWVGSVGDAGLLMIEALPGDVIMKGQKDHRSSRGSAPDYFIVQDDGTLSPSSKVDAFKHWRSRTLAETPA